MQQHRAWVRTENRDSAFFHALTKHCCMCRLRHADVLEWMWFLNDHHEVMYKCASSAGTACLRSRAKLHATDLHVYSCQIGWGLLRASERWLCHLYTPHSVNLVASKDCRSQADHVVMPSRAFWGDTGAPLLAFTLAKKPAEFMQIAKRPAAALDSRGDHHIFTGLVQHDAFGRACFMHRVGDFKFEPTR